MKYSEIFRERIGCFNDEEVFSYFMKNLKETIKSWDFFVSWDKVHRKVDESYELLRELNSIIGKNNIRQEFRALLLLKPEVGAILPILLAIREKQVKVLDSREGDIFRFEEYRFDKPDRLSEEQVERLVHFADKSGILNLLSSGRISNLADFVAGVEVGLDSNARKNRSGEAMERITEYILSDIAQKRGYRYIPQATSRKIKKEFGYDVIVDKSERSFDYAVDVGDKLYLIETNYYGGGGSKLKSVAGEFTTLYGFIREKTPQHGFIWITDGRGWETTVKPLREAFNKIDYILNLQMLQEGLLEEIFSRKE